MIINVDVKPNAKLNKVETISEGVYKVFLTASPHEGKANAALMKLLAEFFGISKSRIAIKTGKKSKKKVVIISG